MDSSLLYVSRRRATATEIRDIVEAAQARNARLQVTGALIATGARFARRSWKGRAPPSTN